MNPEFQRQLWLRFSISRLLGMPMVILLAALAFYVLSDSSLEAVSNLGAVGFVLMTAGIGVGAAANSVTDELLEQTWDQQRLCAMQPWPMAWGKLLGSTLFAWYGSLFCWAIAVTLEPASMPLLQSALLTVLGILVGLAAQALALTFSLVAAEHGGTRQGRAFTWLALLLVVPWLLGFISTSSSRLDESVQWYGLTTSALKFLLASAALACICALTAAWRSMARALLVRQWPWGWLTLGLIATIYIAGLMPDITWPLFAVVGFVVASSMTYLALLQERASLPTWKRLVADARSGDWSAAIQSLPLWPTTLTLAALFTLLLPWSDLGSVLDFLQASLPVLLLLLMRDCMMALCIGFSVRARSATAVFLLYMLVAWLLLPLILSGEATRPALVLVMPVYENSWTALIVALAHALLAAFLLTKVVRLKTRLAT